LKCRKSERAYLSIASSPACRTAFIGSILNHKNFQRHRHNQLEIGVSPTLRVRLAASRTAANASGRMVLTATPVQAFRLEYQLFDSAGAPGERKSRDRNGLSQTVRSLTGGWPTSTANL
jgi:hypothetical protein